ncbi:hypothetical protein [Microbacterium sp. 22242]|uniref:hypothetical protein n=1 Tax=Microbacterium sp. 22242 TaxID=3453896 RepID=UPI003F82E5C2
MDATPTWTARRRLALIGLIAGPALLLLSSVFIIPDAPGGMRATFDAMAAQPWLLLVQSVLEAAGFAVTLAAFTAVAASADRRGGVLATTGTVLCVLGVLGFTWSASGGMFLSVMARMADRDAGFAAAQAMAGDPVTGGLISVLMYTGEAGILLVLIGLLRARRIRIWPIVLVVAGIAADLVLPGILSGLVADALLLGAGVWTVLSLRDGRQPAPREDRLVAAADPA